MERQKQSFLKPYIDNYELFETFDNIILFSYFRPQVRNTFIATVADILKEVDSTYASYCKENKISSTSMKGIILGKTENGDFYMLIPGVNRKTELLIYPDSEAFVPYDIDSHHITEEDFQKRFYANSLAKAKKVFKHCYLPNRYLNETPLENPALDLGSYDVVEYVKYLENLYIQNQYDYTSFDSIAFSRKREKLPE